MAKRLDKFSGIVADIYEKIACVLVAMIIFILFWQVFTRYILNSSATWTEELARFCFIWMTMLGSAIVTREGGHASITLLADKLKGKASVIQVVCVQTIIIILALVFGISMFPLLKVTATRLSTSLQLPYIYVYSSVPIGFLGVFINAVNNIVRVLVKNHDTYNEG